MESPVNNTNDNMKKLTLVEDSQALNMNRGSEEGEMEIDLLDLAFVLLDKLHIIMVVVLAMALMTSAYSYFMIAPTYQSTSKLYIVSSSKDSVIDIADLNIGTTLTKDYEQLILSYPVLDQVIDALNLEMSSRELSQMISLTNPADTRILNITVTSTDPQQSVDIANTLAKVSVRYLPKTMGTNSPNIAQKARLPQGKAGPSCLKYTMIGGLLGLLICCGLYTMQYIMDDTIHSSDDMERYFGLVPLTTIPESKEINDGEDKKKKTKKRKKKLWKLGLKREQKKQSERRRKGEK
jgi:capsular polysaccharide biosynthesis protein